MGKGYESLWNIYQQKNNRLLYFGLNMPGRTFVMSVDCLLSHLLKKDTIVRHVLGHYDAKIAKY